MKRFSLLVAVVVLMSLFAGSALAANLTIGMVFQEMDNEYFIVMHEALSSCGLHRC